MASVSGTAPNASTAPAGAPNAQQANARASDAVTNPNAAAAFPDLQKLRALQKKAKVVRVGPAAKAGRLVFRVGIASVIAYTANLGLSHGLGIDPIGGIARLVTHRSPATLQAELPPPSPAATWFKERAERITTQTLHGQQPQDQAPPVETKKHHGPKR